MIAESVIIKKRDGKVLSEDEIRFIVEGFLSGEVADYQMTAFLMAIYFQGMNLEENFHLTKNMVESGKQLDLTHLPRVAADKHSTGGVGDKVSIVLAPLMAIAGLNIPMISGRALGHSGGTLDKLESIPGFNTKLTLEAFVQQLKKINVAMIGQTKEIAPADKKMYALRDKTGTVPSVPLIVSSILSKKIAEGAQILVIDLKVGSGAFFQSISQARKLAERLITISKMFNLKISVLMTSMDQPLGFTVGNSLEVKEAIETLRGGGPHDLIEIAVALGAEMLVLAGLEKNVSAATTKLSGLLSSGKAFDKLLDLVKAQGGDLSVVKNPDNFPRSEHSMTVTSHKNGFIRKIDAFKIGLLSMELGAGRTKINDPIDYRTGVVFKKKEGDAIKEGEVLAELFYKPGIEEKTISKKFFDAVKITDEKCSKKQLIFGCIKKNELPTNNS